jgi:uncharacterized protein (DUF2147 family)
LVLFFKKERASFLKKGSKKLLLLGLAAPLLLAAGPDVTGDWLTEKSDGVITIAPCGGAICGEITGVSDWKPDGSPPRDSTGAPECHLRIIRNMVPGDDGRLHGTITDPRDGDVYQAELWRGDDGTLRLRGYIGLPLLGSTQTWTRFTGKRQPDCHFSAS